MKQFLTAPIPRLGSVGRADRRAVAEPEGKRHRRSRSVRRRNVVRAGVRLGQPQGQGRCEERRHRKRLIGTRLLTGLKADGQGSYKGRVFLPRRNMHAGATVRAAGNDVLLVKGCVVAGMVCQQQRWTRVTSRPACRARPLFNLC